MPDDDLDELAAHLRDAGDLACANCGERHVAVQCDSCREWQCDDCWGYGRNDTRVCASCAAANR